MSRHRCKCGHKGKMCRAGKDGQGLFCPNCNRNLTPPKGYHVIDPEEFMMVQFKNICDLPNPLDYNVDQCILADFLDILGKRIPGTLRDALLRNLTP